MIDTKNRHFYYTEVDCNEVVSKSDFDEACEELEKCYSDIKDKESIIEAMVDVGKCYTKEDVMEIFEEYSDYTHSIGWAISKEDLEKHL